MSLPLVAIIWRPNVWKSSLFNRLCNERISIVSSISWTTRDRIYTKIAEENSIPFLLVDTWWLDFDTKWELEQNTQMQANVAITDASLIIFLIESKSWITPEELEITKILRKANKTNIIIAISKCDNSNEVDLWDYYKLWFWKPIQISSFHNKWFSELKRLIDSSLKEIGYSKIDFEKEVNTKWNISIVGRPNVWKSSLINALLNDNQLIVSNIPWTTRDSTDTEIKFESKTYNLIDTAWIRRSWKIEKWIEKYSLMRTISSLERSNVTCLLIDAEDWLTSQDQKIIHLVLENYNWLILIVNKWDLEEKWEDAKNAFIGQLRRKLPFIPWAPVLFMSAKTKKGIVKIFPIINQIIEERAKKITTGKLNTFVQKIVNEHPPSWTKRVKPKIFYMTQIWINPPHFKIFVNKKEYFHFSYLRYIENKIREIFWFWWTAIKIDFWDRKSIYDK